MTQLAEILTLAKGGWDYIDSASDGTAHSASDTYLNPGTDTKPRTACAHWIGFYLYSGASVTAITKNTGVKCYGLPAPTEGGFFSVVGGFTSITISGKALLIRQPEY
jgi:hypothetical protein